MRPRIPLVATATIAVAAALSPSVHAADYADTARAVLVPGQAGGIPTTPNSTDQVALYDGLTPKFDQVTARDINTFFKPNVFGTRGQGPTRVERTPNRRVRIVRDKWGVPHVTARRRADVLYGAGFVTAQDRQLLLEIGRGPGRLAILDAPGVDAFGLIEDLRSFEPSAQADQIVGRQAKLLRRAGSRGRQTLADIDAYVRGINGFYQQSGQIQSGAVKPWTRVDMLAVSGFIGSIFGRAGGQEHVNAQFLAALQAKLGDAAGRSVFDDLRLANDPERPNSLDRRASYPGTSADRSGNAPIDDGSFTPAPRPKTVAKAPAERRGMSNALVVSARRSATRHPLFVAGPQIGYYYPGLVLEMDLHGGGIDVRGIASAGAGPYVFIGRGQDFSWSLTSGYNDMTDVYVESLCGNSDQQYLFKGTCKQMTVTDAGVLKGSGGQPDEQIRFLETVHGPVIGYATSGGQRVAISRKRSTRGREALSLLPFNDLNSNRVNSARAFNRSIARLEHTFNGIYADDRDIAQFSTGRLPIRPSNVDPALPARGTGRNEWGGFLPARRHAQQINPRSGFILNWNQRPAPGFGSADDDWDYGPVHRVELFDPIKSVRRARMHNVVGVMNAAGTQDLRSNELTPLIADVLRTSAAPNPRAQRMLELLLEWNNQGSSRLDRDNDGKVDHPGAPIWDAFWPRLADTVLNPVLGDLTARFNEVNGRGGTASSEGNAFGGGWFSHVDKDLRTLLGQNVQGKFSNRYCGGGNFEACQGSIWAALDAAGAELEAAQGADPGAWRADANAERITFAPGLIPDTMRWTNRPTYQQVNSFDGHRRR